MSGTRPAKQPAAAARRRAREKSILAATRALFDESGVRDAQIEDVARAVGVNRAIIYRHFSGKEELFALTLVSYLEELQERLSNAGRSKRTAITRLSAMIEEFVDFGVDYPAFVDCALTLMRRPGPELFEEISENALFRLGRAISGCLREVAQVLDAGTESGEFKVADSMTLANHMYASGLGALQLARLGMTVSEAAPGIPEINPISPEQVKTYLVQSARALATAPA